MNGSTVRTGFFRALFTFTVVQSLLIVVASVLLMRFVWTGDDAARAIRASALLAVGVQVVTFSIAKYVTREQVMAGWGLGVLLRFATAAVWAFLGVKALALVVAPALISLVVFFAVSTLVEPIFLNS